MQSINLWPYLKRHADVVMLSRQSCACRSEPQILLQLLLVYYFNFKYLMNFGTCDETLSQRQFHQDKCWSEATACQPCDCELCCGGVVHVLTCLVKLIFFSHNFHHQQLSVKRLYLQSYKIISVADKKWLELTSAMYSRTWICIQIITKSPDVTDEFCTT